MMNICKFLNNEFFVHYYLILKKPNWLVNKMNILNKAYKLPVKCAYSCLTQDQIPIQYFLLQLPEVALC